MDKHSADIEPVTVSEILELGSWNRERSSEELRRFISSHHDLLPEGIDVE
jgi:hypothetical protein